MHFSPISLLTTALLVLPQVAQVQANFDVYRVKWYNAGFLNPRTAYVWQFFEAEPRNCEHVIDTPIWNERDSVHGSSMGVRCKGEGCDQVRTPEDIEQLEMHTGNDPLLHFTLYKDRGLTMVGLDGNVYGDCMVFPHGDFNCYRLTLRMEGRRKFRCLTRFSADDMSRQA